MVRRCLWVLVMLMFAGLAVRSVRADVSAERFVKTRMVGSTDTVEHMEKVAFQNLKKRSDPITDYKSGSKLLWGSAKQWTIQRLDKDLVWQVHEAKKAYTENPLSSLKQAPAKEEKESPNKHLVSSDAKIESTGKKKTINGFSTSQTLFTWSIEVEDLKTKKHTKCRLTGDFWNADSDPGLKALGSEELAFEAALRKKLGLPAMALTEGLFGLEVAQTDFCAGITDKPLDLEAARAQLMKIGGIPVLLQVTWETDDEEAPAEGVSAMGLAKEAVGGVLGLFKDDEEEKKERKKGEMVAFFEATMEVKKVETGAVDPALFEVPTGFKRVDSL